MGENLSFFATADDINDGNLSIFKGGVENNGDEFLMQSWFCVTYRLSSWMVRRCSEPTLFAACSADDDNSNGDNNGVSGGELWSQKNGELFLGEQLPTPV